MQSKSYTAILEKEGDLYVALCPELDVASQGASVEAATANLKEAAELFLECADPHEIAERERCSGSLPRRTWGRALSRSGRGAGGGRGR